MGDYLEEILDSNDAEIELMAALDEEEMFSEYHYKELFFDEQTVDGIDVDDPGAQKIPQQSVSDLSFWYDPISNTQSSLASVTVYLADVFRFVSGSITCM